MVLAAISRETHPIGLIDTISSFYEPYLAACMLSSLHQISHSCIGAKLDNQYIHPLHYQEKYFQVDGAIVIQTPKYGRPRLFPVSYTHLTLPTIQLSCRSRWSPYH